MSPSRCGRRGPCEDIRQTDAVHRPLIQQAKCLMAGLSCRLTRVTGREATKADEGRAGGIMRRHGTTPRPWRSCGMERLTVGRKAALLWQKLATALAVLAAVMFVLHAAAAKGAVSFLHDQHLSHAGASVSHGDGAHEAKGRHGCLQVAAHMHGPGDTASSACCDEACLAALVPDDDPPLGDPWGMPSRCALTASALTGHDPERLRRPPRLSPEA